MLKTLAISNQKGGVGKTATALALGELLAQKHKVLLIDADPQMSLTESLRLTGPGLSKVLGVGEPGTATLFEIAQEIKPSLFVAPADKFLVQSEVGLVTRMGREAQLKKALAKEADQFDLCIIDCPPGLGMLTINALVAADAVLIPTQPQAADLRGLSLFLQTLQQVRENLNPGLKTLGVAITFFDARLNHHNEAIALIKKADLPLLSVRVGRSVRVAEAMGLGQSVISYAPDNKITEAYKQLGKVVEQWLKKKQ